MQILAFLSHKNLTVAIPTCVFDQPPPFSTSPHRTSPSSPRRQDGKLIRTSSSNGHFWPEPRHSREQYHPDIGGAIAKIHAMLELFTEPSAFVDLAATMDEGRRLAGIIRSPATVKRGRGPYVPLELRKTLQ